VRSKKATPKMCSPCYARQPFYNIISYYTHSLAPYQGSALDPFGGLGTPKFSRLKSTPTPSHIPRSAPDLRCYS